MHNEVWVYTEILLNHFISSHVYFLLFAIAQSMDFFFNENTVLRGVSFIFAHLHLQTTEHF